MSGNCRIPHSGRFMPRGGSPPPASPHHDSSHLDLVLYAGADMILFLTHGPVRLAITGRTLSDGSAAGVAMGDALWPPLTIFALLRLAASAILLTMGMLLNLQDGRSTAADRRLTRPDTPAGFFSCIAVHRPPGRYLSIWAFSPPLRVRQPWGHRHRLHLGDLARCALSRQPGSRAFHRPGAEGSDLAPSVAPGQSPPGRDADCSGTDHSLGMTPNLVAAA